MQLTRGGQAVTAISVASGASKVERFAARELARYVRKISGASLKVGAGKSAVFVGRATGSEAGGMAPESYRIRADSSCLRILGADDRGTLYGVYALIHDYLGVAWPHFRESEETIPSKKSIRLSDIDHYDEPYLQNRHLIMEADPRTAAGRDFFAWAAKNRLNRVSLRGGEAAAAKAEEEAGKRGLEVVIGGHNFGGWMPADEYFESHPDYFALIDGRRQPLSICATNPAVIALHVEKILEFTAKYPGIRHLGFWAYDGYEWCECARCEAVEKQPWYSPVNPNSVEGGRTRMHTYRYLRFCNEVIGRVAAKRADVRFELIAYWATLDTPPKLDFEVHPSANLMVAMIERMYDRPLSHKLTPAEAKGLTADLHEPWDRTKYGYYPDMLRRWRKVFNGPLYFYEYYTASLGCLNCLFPMMYTIREDSRFYKKLGAQGFGSQGWLHNWPAYRVSYWYSATASWDGDSSHEQILGCYCREYFGRAGEAIFNIFRILEKSFARHRIGLHLRQMVLTFDPKTMARCAPHLAQAKKRANDGRTRARVDQIGVLLEYGARLRECAEAGNAANAKLQAGEWAGSYAEIARQMELQLKIVKLLERRDIFSDRDRDYVHKHFAGRGSYWTRNEWGMFHLFKKLEPLEFVIH